MHSELLCTTRLVLLMSNVWLKGGGGFAMDPLHGEDKPRGKDNGEKTSRPSAQRQIHHEGQGIEIAGWFGE